jgi:hypothetical protein
VTWIITTYVPMPGAYKQVLVGVVILLVALWLVRILIGPLPRVVMPWWMGATNWYTDSVLADGSHLIVWISCEL